MTRLIPENRDIRSEAAGGSALAVEARSGSGSALSPFGFAHPRAHSFSGRRSRRHDYYYTPTLPITSHRRTWLPTRPARGLPVLKVTMKPQRDILPAGPTAASSASSERESTPQSATGSTPSAPRRRPQTKIACTSCRRRKSKCDGMRPVCSLCAGMGRTKCEYDAGPDVTRFAALKTKHEGLQRRLALFEELFRLLSMRSDAESLEIISRMRIANIETDIEDLVKFIKNADLLMQLSSTQADHTPPASGALGAGTHPPGTPLNDISSLFELLKSVISKLDPSARSAFLDTIRHQIDVFTSHEGNRPGSAETVKLEEIWGTYSATGGFDTSLCGSNEPIKLTRGGNRWA
ncbi:hypothetical protein LZ31DRAFT_582532 [Colletotrichum somersetense]|nr:hypothetical protein LZ31DRAFT_582532 [Colletotrichum somersetense]